MKRRYSIHFLLSQDLGSPSGSGRYLPMARELANRGHRVVISALHPDYASLEQRILHIDGVEVRYLAPMHVRKQGNVKTYYSNPRLVALAIRAGLTLFWAALRTPADMIHVGKPHPMNGLAGWLAGRLKRNVVLLDLDDEEAASNRFSGAWQFRVVEWVETWLPKHVDHLTVNTFYLKSKLLSQGIPEPKITVISNGVERRRFEQRDSIAPLARELQLTDRKVVAYIGSLSLTSHPVELLLDAFGIICHTLPDCRLLLVGGGEDYETVQQMVQQKGISGFTVMTGRVDPAEAPKYYRLASVVVDPVYDDRTARGRSPLKLFESWVSGVPFVTSCVGDRRLLIGETRAGMLARPGDAGSLANEILAILTQPELARQIADRGKEVVKDYYWDRLVDRVEIAYEQASGSTGIDER